MIFIVQRSKRGGVRLASYAEIVEYVLGEDAAQKRLHLWQSYGDSWVLWDMDDEVAVASGHERLLIKHYTNRTPRGLGAQVHELDTQTSISALDALTREVRRSRFARTQHPGLMIT